MKKVYISKRAISTNLGVQIRVAKRRSKPITDFPHGVGQIQHEGTKHIPARPWFGISSTAVKRIDKMLGLKLAKELKNSWGLR